MSIFEQWGWRWDNWHKGERGEYWLLAQGMSLILFAVLPTLPMVERTRLSPSTQTGLTATAGLLGTIAVILIGKGLLDLGQSLTPLPYPREDGQLVTTGIYGIVRHPLYGGIILAGLGWVLLTLSWSHCLCLLGIVVLLERKATLEEKWLEQKYSDYVAYRQTAKKLVPWIW